MTLIVSQKCNEDIFIVGDTKLLNMNQVNSSPLKGTLKVQVINPHLCVGFAGIISHRVIDEMHQLFYSNNSTDISSIIAALHGLHIRENENIDFIIADKINEANLYKISAGQIVGNLQNAWIGDHDAFNLYQQYVHNPKSEIPDNHPGRSSLWTIKLPDHENVNSDLFSQMCKAMRSVINDSEVVTVGDYLLPVSTTNNGLNYMLYVDIDAPPHPLVEGWNTVQFGNAAQGGYAITLLTPIQSGFPAVGIHFFQGNFGVLFAPQISFSPITFKNMNRNQFIESAIREHGIELQGAEIH